MFKLSKAKSGKAATPMAVSFVPFNIQNTEKAKSATPAYPKPLGASFSTFSFG